MKRLLIASVVGTIILYVYLALSHTVLNMHYSDYKYTPAQDSITRMLSSYLNEDGVYMTPYFKPDATMDEVMHDMESRMGKPWAMINYHGSMENETMSYVMSFVYNFMSILILCIALAAASVKLNSFAQRLWFVMLFALFVIFADTMMRYNWEGYSMQYLKGQISDVLIGYFVAGLWLAWYYGRLEKKTE